MVNAYYPKSADEALRIRHAHPGAQLVCGGTDAMVRKVPAEDVILLGSAADLKDVTREKDGRLLIGAAATYAQLLRNPLLPDILHRCITGIASPAVRSAGTIAGNVCNASPAGDTLPVLYILDAQAVIGRAAEDGTCVFRREPVPEFIKGVRKIDLAPDEIVTGISLDLPSYTDMNHRYYEKVGARKAEAISKVSFAACARTASGAGEDGAPAGTIEAFRVSFGSVGVSALRFPDLEREICGMTVREAAGKRELLLNRYMERIHPISDQRSTAEYRSQVCRNLLGTFLDSLAEDA